MKTIKTIKINTLEASLLENELLYIYYTVDVLDDIEVIKEQTQRIREEFDLEAFYIISNTSKIKHVTKEVRKFSARLEILGNTKAMAIVVGSGVSRIVGNFYLKIAAPSVPTKLFTNFEKAQTWLLKEKAKRENTLESSSSS